MVRGIMAINHWRRGVGLAKRRARRQIEASGPNIGTRSSAG